MTEYSAGDAVIVEGKGNREIWRVLSHITATEIRCSRGLGSSARFKIATGKEVGGSRMVRKPKPGEIKAIERAERESEEVKERKYQEEKRKRAEYEATPHYQLAVKVCKSKSDWDWPTSWAEFSPEQLQQIWQWVCESKGVKS